MQSLKHDGMGEKQGMPKASDSLHRMTREHLIIAMLLVLVAALCIALGYSLLAGAPPCAGCNAKVEMVSSPGAEDEVVSLIRSAKETVDVEIYVFTSEVMVKELSDAQKRGVRVRVIMEPRVEDSRKGKIFSLLEASGIEVRWASFGYKLTHSKMVIVDGKAALVGSINFSESALRSNREVAILVEGDKVKELANLFEEDWGKAGAG